MNKKSWIILFVFTFLAFSGDLSSKEKIFEELNLKLEGNVQTSFKTDVDSDEADELAVVFKKGNYPKTRNYLEVYDFEKSATGKYKSKKIFSRLLDEKFALIDQGKCFSGEKACFFFMAQDGVYLLAPPFDKKFEQIIKRETIVGTAEKGDLPYFDFVKDYDGDLESEVLIALKGGYEFYDLIDIELKPSFLSVEPRYYYASGYGDLPFDRKYGFRSIFFTHDVKCIDFNGDSKKDMIFLFEDEMDVFFQGEGDGFTDKNHVHYFLGDLDDKERDERETYVVYFLDDLDSNGLPDLIKNKFKGAFTSHVSKTTVVLRNEKKSLKGKEIKIIPEEGVWQGAINSDANGDGKSDLILSSASFGIFSILKAVLKGKIDIKFSFYHFKRDVAFKDTPDYTRTISVGFDLRRARMEGILPTLENDFNRDGLKDVFYAPNNEEVRLILNRKGKDFSFSRIKKQRLKVGQNHFFADFNGDKRTDISMFYPQGEMRKDLKILFSSL